MEVYVIYAGTRMVGYITDKGVLVPGVGILPLPAAIYEFQKAA